MFDTFRHAFATCSVLIAGAACSALGITSTRASDPTASIVSDEVVFEEAGGTFAVEAEHFYQQTLASVRAWHITSSQSTPDARPDGDPAHVAGAAGGTYVKVLPDTRRTHGDKLIKGENFSPEPGKMAILHYKVHFSTPGRYYVWVRAHSTGSEDNGLHVGIDGTWPASGQRLQWCAGKRTWRWESKQRTQKEHCGEPHKIYLEIKKPGEHTIHFSMREDGFEFDKWLMTTNREFQRPEDTGPLPVAKRGTLPKAFPFVQPNRARATTPATAKSSPRKPLSNAPQQLPRQRNGDGKIQITGKLKQWHKVTLSLNGPYAHEQDNEPNPFTDYRMTVSFIHADGTQYVLPGYFAADGNAANSSAKSGTVWRVHFAPDKTGQWFYNVSFNQGKNTALVQDAASRPLAPFDDVSGSLRIDASDKQGRDLRASGRLQYVGKHHLQFAGSGRYFLKVGADTPETLLAYADFDNTIAGNPKKAPLKSWSPHVKDWNAVCWERQATSKNWMVAMVRPMFRV